MKALILNALSSEKDAEIENILKSELEKKGWQFEIFTLRDLDIKPCASCGNCAVKTPGLCSRGDGMKDILASWVQSGLVIFLTPVSFGGYHSELKKVIDRILPLKNAYFTVYRGELHHENRYKPMPSLLTIGMLGEENREERESFRYLTERNAVNMLVDRYAAAVFSENDGPGAVKNHVAQALKEVG